MNLKDIICDFEYADRLAELGISRESLFGFCNDKRSVSFAHKPHVSLNSYTVTELGEMLASEHIDNYLYCDLFTEKEEHFYSCGYEGTVVCRDKKEANARAKLLIWLIENDHVNVEELNK